VNTGGASENAPFASATTLTGVSVPVEAVQGLARHNVKEFTRWREFLPRIYAELGPGMYC